MHSIFETKIEGVNYVQVESFLYHKQAFKA